MTKGTCDDAARAKSVEAVRALRHGGPAGMTERLSDVSARIRSVRQLASVIAAMRGIAAARAREARADAGACAPMPGWWRGDRPGAALAGDGAGARPARARRASA